MRCSPERGGGFAAGVGVGPRVCSCVRGKWSAGVGHGLMLADVAVGMREG